MSDETRPVQVHRIVLLIVDTDGVGAGGIKQVIENARYPNRCIDPIVLTTETITIAYNDEHPLTCTLPHVRDPEIARLFPTVKP